MTIPASHFALAGLLALVGRKGKIELSRNDVPYDPALGGGLWDLDTIEGGAKKLGQRTGGLLLEELSEAAMIGLADDTERWDEDREASIAAERVLRLDEPDPGFAMMFGPGVNVVLGTPAAGKTLFARTIALGLALPREADIHLFEAYDDSETGDLPHFARKMLHGIKASPVVVVDSMQHFYLFGDAASSGGIYLDVLLTYGGLNSLCLTYGITLILLVNPAKGGEEAVRRLAEEHTSPTNSTLILKRFDQSDRVFSGEFIQRFGDRRWRNVSIPLDRLAARTGSTTIPLFHEEAFAKNIYRSPYTALAEATKKVILDERPGIISFQRI